MLLREINKLTFTEECNQTRSGERVVEMMFPTPFLISMEMCQLWHSKQAAKCQMFARQGCEEEGEGCSMAGMWSDTQVPAGEVGALSKEFRRRFSSTNKK